MNDILIIGYKNKYNYTVNQLKVDFKKSTYQIGSFKILNDETVTRKEFYKKIELLKKLNFKRIGE